MRIVSLEVEYPESGWKLEKMTFDSMNLLVGVSGVGKTRILNAILAIKRLAQGQAFTSNFSWAIEVVVPSGKQYSWSGRTDNSSVTSESLKTHEKEVFSRLNDQVVFEGGRLPSLNKELTLLCLLGSNADISEIWEGFRGCIDAHGWNHIWKASFNDANIAPLFSTSEILATEMPNRLKLYHAKKAAVTGDTNIFSEIAREFISIFSGISYLDVTAISVGNQEVLIELWFLENDTKILYEDWSSGMQAAFNLLVSIFLSKPGSIFLIDEFENSLGVNCIHAVTDSIMQAKREHQFIITSHHPYIINNVPFKHWKIITRKGSVVTAHNSEEFRLGKSKHEAFFQLVNLEEFREGVTA